MDSLLAKANAIDGQKRRRTGSKPSSSHAPSKDSSSSGPLSGFDKTSASIAHHTALPKSLRDGDTLPEHKPEYGHIANKKLRATLNRQSAQSARAKALVEDAELLRTQEGGMMQVEDEMERTWRITQSEVGEGAGSEAGKGRKEYRLDGGPYRCRYTRNGRHLAIVGKSGHVATFDWQSGTMHAELQLQETCRDITFLHDQSHFAVAQKKYAFIYDKDGVELHRLKNHVEPTRLEFLPYHWLLASTGNTGYLKYQDTSTGQLVVEHRTKLGAIQTMTQNMHNAVIYLGHQNGTTTLWTPNMPTPAVRLLSHIGPVCSVSVDPSSAGRYMATAGMDGMIKVWDCRNWKGTVREWNARGGTAEVEWSARGALAVATGGSVNVYTKPSIQTPFKGTPPPPLYMTHPIPHRPLSSVRFCPFQDILTVGHAQGLSSILVPGAGEPNFDSAEADPFENKNMRREREVRGLLDKIQPDMIALDADFIGSLAPPTKLTTAIDSKINGKDGKTDTPFARLPRLERLRVQGKADEPEDEDDAMVGGDGEGAEGEEGNHATSRAVKEKNKMRGKGKSIKRYLRKQRKNVIDPKAVAVRAKLEKEREERRQAKAIASGTAVPQKPSALDRFKRKN